MDIWSLYTIVLFGGLERSRQVSIQNVPFRLVSLAD